MLERRQVELLSLLVSKLYLRHPSRILQLTYTSIPIACRTNASHIAGPNDSPSVAPAVMAFPDMVALTSVGLLGSSPE